ncbi:MAG: ATP-binding protein [Deltaproteobacteria bacterium]
MIRTRWLVAIVIIVVAGIGALVYRDETARSDAALEDLGERQAELASIAASAFEVAPADARAKLAERQHRGSLILIAPPGGDLKTLAGDVVSLPALSRAIANDATSLRLTPEDASSLGFPARTAMVGLSRTSDGGMIAVATSAEHQRDRDRSGRDRVLLSMALAAAVMTAFTYAIWKKQHHEAELARDLAVAEAARARDADLDRLHRAATMAALGSGVAHELSTPLGVIVGRAEQLLTRAAGDERSIKSVQVILEQTDHINQVVRGLLGLARGAPIALQSVEAEDLVTEAAALVQHRFVRANVVLEPHVASRLPEIRCEPLLFKHALINLLLNACDASPPRSTVRVDVTADAVEIAFVVTDEGEGITPQHAKRATEPFFTTKPPGEGTGLGLAIANEIAKTHRGSLDLAQRSPHGTRACIRIPLESSPA